jgi:hypothetical protein
VDRTSSDVDFDPLIQWPHRRESVENKSGTPLFQQSLSLTASSKIALKSIKTGSKELTAVKLFFVAKSRRMSRIRRLRLIRI